MQSSVDEPRFPSGYVLFPETDVPFQCSATTEDTTATGGEEKEGEDSVRAGYLLWYVCCR